jgi:hypothetical protein
MFNVGGCLKPGHLSPLDPNKTYLNSEVAGMRVATLLYRVETDSMKKMIMVKLTTVSLISLAISTVVMANECVVKMNAKLDSKNTGDKVLAIVQSTHDFICPAKNGAQLYKEVQILPKSISKSDLTSLKRTGDVESVHILTKNLEKLNRGVAIIFNGNEGIPKNYRIYVSTGGFGIGEGMNAD